MSTPTKPHSRSRLDKVCVAITGTTAGEMLRRAEAALGDVSFLEFRLDCLEDPVAALPLFQTLFARRPEVTAIATCRRAANGGQFMRSIADELEVLSRAANAGFQWLDLEIEAAEAITTHQLVELRSQGASLMVSYHDFAATGDLHHVLDRMQRLSPDLAKIVPTAQSLTDNLTLFQILKTVGASMPVVAMCMGERGIPSRILGPRFGSVFTFASTAAGEESAPGQMSARTLLDLYRLEKIDAATRVYGVAGTHVRSSLSPLMHNTAFGSRANNAVYLPLRVDAVDDLLRLTRELPLSGLSVTMPYKQQILPHLDRCDELSRRIGAVNTVVHTPDGTLSGFNTDVAGITDPLERRLGLKSTRILLLGAGGAARAAAFGLVEKGATVAILNRTPELARQLASESGASVVDRSELPLHRFDVLINATPLGMAGFSDATPLRADELHTDLVFDLVYNPLETPLLRLARRRGMAVVSGLEMFVAQGARQFELWTGQSAPTKIMHDIVERALLAAESSPVPRES